jgi:hypothetical protein
MVMRARDLSFVAVENLEGGSGSSFLWPTPVMTL